MKKKDLAPLMARRAALYIRVSTDEQARHGYSLAEQKLDLEKYAAQKGFVVVGLYADEGCSARKAISRRHALQNLLHDIEQGRVDVVVMKCLDRWMRSVKDFYKVQETLDAHGVALEFSQESDYNTSTTSGRLMLNLKLTIAQHESDTTGDRIRYAFAGMRRQKRVISGRVPFGYRLENKKIVIDEPKAEIVRFCFRRVAEGHSIYSLLDVIFERFGVVMMYDTLKRMIHNPGLTGKIFGVEGMAEPIISKEEFDRVQIAAAHRPRKTKDAFCYLFVGIVICPCCGRRLYGRRPSDKKKQRRSAQYLCVNRHNKTKAASMNEGLCSYSSCLSESRIEQWLLENVARLVKDCQASAPPPKKKKSPLESIRAKMERLQEVYIEGGYSKNEYHRRLDALKAKERAALEADMKETNTAKKLPAVLLGKDFRAIYETWTREQRRTFWHSTIKTIEFDRKPLTRGTPLDFRVTFL